MILWGLEVLEKTRALWPRDSKEGGLIETAIAQKNANLARLRGKQALSTGNVDAAVVQLSEANRYYRNITLSSIILLLRLAPRLMRCLFRLRGIVRTCIDRAG